MPTGAGVSLRLPSAFTNPESSVTAVSLPLSAGISATGLTVSACLGAAEALVVSLSEPPQALAPSARAAVAARAVKVFIFMVIYSHQLAIRMPHLARDIDQVMVHTVNTSIEGGGVASQRPLAGASRPLGARLSTRNRV